MPVAAILGMIPWKLIAKLGWMGVARPLLKLIVQKTETKGDDRFFEFLDDLMTKLLGGRPEHDKEVQALFADQKFFQSPPVEIKLDK
jgi:hypothetical protein